MNNVSKSTRSKHTWISHLGKKSISKCAKCGAIRRYVTKQGNTSQVVYDKNGEEFIGVSPPCANYFDENNFEQP